MLTISHPPQGITPNSIPISPAIFLNKYVQLYLESILISLAYFDNKLRVTASIQTCQPHTSEKITKNKTKKQLEIGPKI